MTARVLSIAIQTYNRGTKAERVVRRFMELIQEERLEQDVEIHVSDNASTDDTEQRLRPLASEQPVCVRYTRQPTNLEFDGNTAFLYEAGATPYMWLFGDDDMPFPGALTKVVTALRELTPSLLLFSFAQPPGNPKRTFDFPKAIHEVLDPSEQARLVVRYTKLSIFVYKRVALSGDMLAVLDRYQNSGWYYVGLAYSILASTPQPRLAIISEQLAGSDGDWARVAYSPKPYITLGAAVDHPFVRKAAPELIKRVRRGGYRTAVSWCLQAKLGRLNPERPDEYDTFFWTDLPFRPLVLLGSPRAALAYFLVWSGLWRLLPQASKSR